MRRLLALLAALAAAPAWADGGSVRIQADAGALRITAFSAPEPLRVGEADLSVLVQQRENGEPVLGAEVTLRLEGPTTASPIVVRATRAAATNRLLHAARVELPEAGTWRLQVEVRQQHGVVEVDGALPVAPPAPRLASLWPYLALPPGALALFALREWLVLRRMRA